jgi:tRNA threonylcarbamoyladenosine biosynthesis protein TsaB
MTRLLAIDAALARCSAALLADGELCASRQADGARGHAATLPVLVEAVLAAAGDAVDALAVTIGPGGFTGLRAALSLAEGMALAVGCPLIGVSVGEALAEAAGPLAGRDLWVAIAAPRERVCLERAGAIGMYPLAALPPANRPVVLAGDAAIAVAAALAARGGDVRLSDARLPLACHVAAVGMRRLSGALAPRDVLPLYLDQPRVTRPA